MALFCAAIRRDLVSLLRFSFLCYVHVACSSLNMSIQLFFFPFLFSGYFCSIDPCVVSTVSGGCNQSSLVIFYVVFESLYRCINAIFNAGKLIFLLLYLIYIICRRHLCDVRSNTSSLVLFSGLIV